MPNLRGSIVAEYFGGPNDGRRGPHPAHQCESPDCQAVHAPAWIAHLPGDALRRTDVDGQWEPTKPDIGTYYLRQLDPVDGAYQYDWREGEGTQPPPE